ncbi:MAG: hypothetical protein PWQ91_363 [Eubacteriales bacterium]|nr:hypothetical protein [Eubacteriales bacterium]
MTAAEMLVVGTTTQQYVYVASRTYKFRMNEILIIEDESLGFPRGEVLETSSFNKFIPPATENGFLVDREVITRLQEIGFDLQREEVNVARVRLLEELPWPVRTGVRVRRPLFAEVEGYLLRARPEKGWVVGIIKGTEELAHQMPEELRGLAPVIDRQGQLRQDAGVPFILGYREMSQYPHVGVFGGSGSGKSYGLRVLLEEVMQQRLPAVVFDPHYEMDFATPTGVGGMERADFRDRFRIFHLGRETGVDFSSLRTPEVVKLLQGAGRDFSEAMTNAVEAIHKRGMDCDYFEKLLEKILAFLEGRSENKEEEERLLQYKSLSASTIRGILWRFQSLRRTGLFTGDVAPVETALRQRQVAVIRGSVRVLQLFASYLLNHLYQKRRDYMDRRQAGEEGDYFPPFLVVTDEAHNFAPVSAEINAPARSIIREIAQEGRKYGVFLVLATQRPRLLDETVTAQLNTKFIFRTVRHSDISVIQEETDITKEEAGRLPYLPSGDAFVSSAFFGRTVAIRVRAAFTSPPHTTNPFDEMEEKLQSEEEIVLEVAREGGWFPLQPGGVNPLAEAVGERLGRPVSYDEMVTMLDRLVAKGKLVREESPFGAAYNLVEEGETR